MDSSDIVGIEQTVARFCLGVGRRDLALIASAFAPEGTLVNMSAMLGREDVEIVGPVAIEALFASFLPQMDVIQQMAQTLVTAIDGDRATALTQIREYVQFPGGDMTVFMGIYHDEFVRTAEGWRFARRTIQPLAAMLPKGDVTVL